MKTVKTIMELASDFLKKQGVKRHRYSAEVLLAHFLKVKRLDLYLAFDRPLIEEELVPFRAGLKRKASGEPLEHICGSVEFLGCQIKTTSDALIPRQETEILLDRVCRDWAGKGGKALDLCTGSGCLAIGLKKACPELDVVGVDLSADALALARENGEANGLEIDWREGDLTAPVEGERFDLILCNPPYISEGQYAGLDPSVRDFEPKMALVSGATGLEIYERLAIGLPKILVPNGQIFFEMGSGQGEGIMALFSAPCWREVKVEPDWAGHDRFFSAIFLENE